MVAEFNTWKATAGLSAAELTEREVELNKLFTTCRSTALNPRRSYFTAGGNGYVFGRLGRDLMVGSRGHTVYECTL